MSSIHLPGRIRFRKARVPFPFTPAPSSSGQVLARATKKESSMSRRPGRSRCPSWPYSCQDVLAHVCPHELSFRAFPPAAEPPTPLRCRGCLRARLCGAGSLRPCTQPARRQSRRHRCAIYSILFSHCPMYAAMAPKNPETASQSSSKKPRLLLEMVMTSSAFRHTQVT